jgi:DNA-directed RNA polymerase specialized sigma24 family protein
VSARDKTALDRALEGDGYLRLQRVLMAVASRRGLRGADGEDVVADTFRVAFQHERDGVHWDPAGTPAPNYLANILENVLRERRRKDKGKTKRTSGIEEGQDFADEAPAADAVMAASHELDLKATQLLEHLAKQTDVEGLTLRVVQAVRQGVSGHEALSVHLKCTLAEIRAAYKRIDRRTTKFREQAAERRAS